MALLDSIDSTTYPGPQNKRQNQISVHQPDVFLNRFISSSLVIEGLTLCQALCYVI